MKSHKIIVTVSLFLVLTLALISPGDAAQTYNYTMNKAGLNYQILNINNAVIYASTSSSSAFNYMASQLQNGNFALIQAGAYTIDNTWSVSNVNNVNLVFDGAILTVANAINIPVGGWTAMLLTNCSNVVIQGITINGEALAQTGTYREFENGISLIGCSNVLVNNAAISYFTQFGFYIGNQGNAINNYQTYSNSINSGIQDSIITYCGWNGITLGDGINNISGLYAKNNEISYCSDVGITSYGNNAVITGNNINNLAHYSSNDNHPGHDAKWGIACEAGHGTINNYITIVSNTISNIEMGIVIDSSGSGNINYVYIANNDISNAASTGITVVDSDNSRIEYNSIDGVYLGIGIYPISGTCTANNIYGNIIINYSYDDIINNGQNTTFNFNDPPNASPAPTQPAPTNTDTWYYAGPTIHINSGSGNFNILSIVLLLLILFFALGFMLNLYYTAKTDKGGVLFELIISIAILGTIGIVVLNFILGGL